MAGHFYANIGESDGQRDVNDRYETPAGVTRALLEIFKHQLRGPILEPAAGTGRIARVLESVGFEVMSRDIEESGEDFLEFQGKWPGDLVTNPPYHKGMAEAFVLKALEVADGSVSMLLRGGFLWGQDRSEWLKTMKPHAVIIVPWRIKFYQRSGELIAGQAYDHAWFCWLPRVLRNHVVSAPQVYWANLKFKDCTK